MKNKSLKSIAIALLVGGIGQLHAEDNSCKPVLSVGKVWYYATVNTMHFVNSGELISSLDRYEISGKDGDCYSVIHHDEMQNGKYVRTLVLCEKDQKVFLVPDGADVSSEKDLKIIYDFSIPAGSRQEYDQSEFNPNGKLSLTVNSIDTVKTNHNRLLRRYHTDCGVWLEGVGSIDCRGITPYAMPSNGDSKVFVGCYSDETGLVFNADFYNAAVHMAGAGATANGLPAIQPDVDSPALSDKMYDILGREISSPADGQLFIRGGRVFNGNHGPKSQR